MVRPQKKRIRPGWRKRLGTSGKPTVTAAELGARIGTTAYERLTRINPLVKRIVLD